MTRITCAAIILFYIFLMNFLPETMAQNSFVQGQQFYQQRAAQADSFRASSTNINKAIDAFQRSLDTNINPSESAASLLKSYYFKGMFTGKSEDRRQKIYGEGRELGKNMMEKYPDSAPIKFWYGANIGRWAKVHGFVKAATNGIAKKLRRICKDIIEINPEYQGGGGYRILAQVHFYSPNIPLLMSWPSDEKALELIEKALNIAPDHPTNRMLYGEVLLEFDRHQEAKKQLQYIIETAPRSTHKVEDRYMQYRSRQLLNKHF